MTTIKLNNYYPHLTESVTLEVSEEIAVTLSIGGRMCDSYKRRKVERQHFRVLPFCVSPLPSGKLVRIGTPFYIGGQIMAQTRISYHKEVKTASFQGRTITVENLTPILAPKVRDKRKREIETGLYSVFRKYAPGRAEMR